MWARLPPRPRLVGPGHIGFVIWHRKWCSFLHRDLLLLHIFNFRRRVNRCNWLLEKPRPSPRGLGRLHVTISTSNRRILLARDWSSNWRTGHDGRGGRWRALRWQVRVTKFCFKRFSGSFRREWVVGAMCRVSFGQSEATALTESWGHPTVEPAPSPLRVCRVKKKCGCHGSWRSFPLLYRFSLD